MNLEDLPQYVGAPRGCRMPEDESFPSGYCQFISVAIQTNEKPIKMKTAP
jgi:hypothetical protein